MTSGLFRTISYMVLFKEMSDKVSKDSERMEKLMKRQPRITGSILLPLLGIVAGCLVPIALEQLLLE